MVGHCILVVLEDMLEVGGVGSIHGAGADILEAGADILELLEDILEFVEDIQEFVEDIQKFVEDTADAVAGILGIADMRAGCQVQVAAGGGCGEAGAGGCQGRASGGCVRPDHWGRAGTWRRVALFTVRRPRH